MHIIVLFLMNNSAWAFGPAFQDDDGDGFRPIEGDCDDNDPLRKPWHVELCDGIDNDCDGDVDEYEGIYGYQPYYADVDGDTCADDVVTACNIGFYGYGGGGVISSRDENCNDWVPPWPVSPVVLELCGNGLDDDADGAIDENCPCGTSRFCLSDADADGDDDFCIKFSPEPDPTANARIVGAGPQLDHLPLRNDQTTRVAGTDFVCIDFNERASGVYTFMLVSTIDASGVNFIGSDPTEWVWVTYASYCIYTEFGSPERELCASTGKYGQALRVEVMPSGEVVPAGDEA